MTPTLPHHYRAYGLALHANRPIPGLMSETEPSPADLQVWFGAKTPGLAEILHRPQTIQHVSPYVDEDNSPILKVWALGDDGHVCFAFRYGIQFVVDPAGKQLWISWPEDTDRSEGMVLLLQGFVLGFILRRRGIPFLHASAVAVDGRALALFGPSGAGKSTTAAAFASLGYRVLADDIVALDDRGDRFWVQPGYPRLRLWSDAANGLNGLPSDLPPLVAGWDKRYLELTTARQPFQPQPLPLAAIYLLGQRQPGPTSFEAVSPAQGLVRLLGPTSVPHLFAPNLRLREFDALSRVVAHVPLRQVKPPAGLAALPDLCAAIVADSHTLR